MVKPGDKITVVSYVVAPPPGVYVRGGAFEPRRRNRVFRRGVVKSFLDDEEGAFEFVWDNGDGKIDYVSGTIVIEQASERRGTKWAFGWDGEEVEALKVAVALT